MEACKRIAAYFQICNYSMIRMPAVEMLSPVIGLVAGILGSMFGLGGGFLMVPLLNIAGLDMKIAVGTSVAAIFFNSLSATLAYSRYRLVAFRAGIFLSLTAGIFATIGAWLTRYLDVNTLRVIFGAVLLLLSIRVAALRRGGGSSHSQNTLRWSLNTYVSLLGGGVLAGLASGLLGVGGGIVNVPLLNYIGASMHVAVATSSMAITLTSIPSSLTHYMLGNVSSHILVLLAPSLIVGAQVGARIAKRSSPLALRRGFAVMLIFIALRMILKGLGYPVP